MRLRMQLSAMAVVLMATAIPAILFAQAGPLQQGSSHFDPSQVAFVPRDGSSPGRRDASTASIVLVGELAEPGASAVVLRRRHLQPQNVILVTQRTTPEELSHAVRMIFRSRNQIGDLLRYELRASVPAGPGVTETTTATANHRRAEADLQRVAKAPVQEVPGVGSHRAISITLAATPADGQRPALPESEPERRANRIKPR